MTMINNLGRRFHHIRQSAQEHQALAQWHFKCENVESHRDGKYGLQNDDGPYQDTGSKASSFGTNNK